ncbi:unnamed protein product [Owenia fusiformis]|uniref:Uncharacterized protein n=1 Tax=Owenia fusiformis TaxID=6347 RepID=A0A8J1UQF2_OWEFU|nr:unnamed protein product [Owenia fusiformis]
MVTIIPLPLKTDTLEFLLDQAKDFAITHGITSCNTNDQPQVASHMLLPSPIIRKRFAEAVEVTKDFNELYHKVAHDYNFLRDALKSVLAVDSFTKGLWNIYETVRNEGIAQCIYCIAILGNNFFGDDIKELLSKIKDLNERTQYILMERIRPLVFKNYAVWADKSVELCDMVSELGIYGVIIGTADHIIMNKECGHLVRTKTLGTNEGGLSKEFASLDSPYLV